MTMSFAGRIILASASERRKKLLAEAGYTFEVVPSCIDESAYPAENIIPSAYAEQLALAKARAVAGEFEDCFVIGADTVVDFEGQIVGKATCAEDAERITRKLFNGPHKVITAVAIVKISAGIEIVESDSTIIYPKKLTEQQIAEHIDSRCWQGKAGAYAIKEDGDEFIEKIQGSLTNVIGLPMELLARLLRRCGGSVC